MPFDGIVTLEVNHELQDILIGGKINKIHQPTTTEMIISVRNHSKNHTLLLSVHPSYARMHLTKEKMKNPEELSKYCMVIRKHLHLAVIKEIMQIDIGRIIVVHFNEMNEIGVMTEKTLYIKIIGRHSNIGLVNDQSKKII